MLRGLELLNSEELKEVARLLEFEPDTPQENIPMETLAWMGRQVKVKHSADPGVLERSVLECVAKDWEVEHAPDIDTNDLERLLRRKMATEATAFLAPCWRVACALMVAESSAVGDAKLQMLENAARIVVPSTSVLEEYRAEWDRLSSEWIGEDPRPLLEQDLAVLSQTPELGRKALQLGLVIGLADGRLSADEERLSRDLGIAMGLPEDEAIAVAADLNQLFWKHRNALAEGHTGPEKAEQMALAAANKALAESGALEGLANEAREKLLNEEEEEENSPGLSRLLGALSGLSQFFSARMDEESQARLARIVFLTIKKQRVEVEQLRRRAEQEARRKAAPPPPPPPAPAPPQAPVFPAVGLGSTGAKKKPAQKRSISLD